MQRSQWTGETNREAELIQLPRDEAAGGDESMETIRWRAVEERNKRGEWVRWMGIERI